MVTEFQWLLRRVNIIHMEESARFSHPGFCVFTNPSSYYPEPPSVSGNVRPVLERLHNDTRQPDQRRSHILYLDSTEKRRGLRVLQDFVATHSGAKTRQWAVRKWTMDATGTLPSEARVQREGREPVAAANDRALLDLLGGGTEQLQPTTVPLTLSYAAGSFVACLGSNLRRRVAGVAGLGRVWFARVAQAIYKRGAEYQTMTFLGEWFDWVQGESSLLEFEYNVEKNIDCETILTAVELSEDGTSEDGRPRYRLPDEEIVCTRHLGEQAVRSELEETLLREAAQRELLEQELTAARPATAEVQRREEQRRATQIRPDTTPLWHKAPNVH